MAFKERMKDAAAKAGEKAKGAAQDALDRRAESKAQPELGGDVLFRGVSHEDGRNAEVTLYPDRIERVKERSRLSISRAAQDTEVIPLKAVSSVTAKKAGLRTNVSVIASANSIEFRFGHDEAQMFKNQLLKLIL